MTNHARRLSGILLAAGCLLAVGPKPARAAETTMVVTVVNQHFSPARPVANVGINVSYLDESKKVTAALIHTNQEGQVAVTVSEEAQASGDLHIEIYDAPGLVIYEPAEGMVGATQRQLTLKLLPKGSAALLEPPQIEAMLNKLSRLTLQNQQLRLQITKQQAEGAGVDQQIQQLQAQLAKQQTERAGVDQQIQQLQAQIAKQKGEKAGVDQQIQQLQSQLAKQQAEKAGVDQQIQQLQSQLAKQQTGNSGIDQALQAWATENEFPYSEVKEKVQSWAQDVLAHRQEKSLNEQAEAELGLGDLKDAERDFAKGADSDDDDLARIHRQQRELMEQERTKLRSDVDQRWESARASQLEGDFAGAEAQVTKAQSLATAEHQLYPNDAAFRSVWLIASVLLEVARIQEAHANLTQDSVTGLTGAVKDLSDLLAQMDKTTDSTMWSYTQVFRGAALLYLTARSNDREAADLFTQANAAFQAAAEAIDKGADPISWVSIEAIAGLGLTVQAARLGGPQSIGLAKQAADTFRAALGVTDKASNLKVWSDLQSSLGGALALEAMRAQDNSSPDLIAQAVAAMRAAVDGYDPKKDPKGWAIAEEGLANALNSQGLFTDPSQAGAIFAQAAAAFKSVLDVRTQASDPGGWASTQGSLALVLEEEAEHSAPDQAKKLLDQSIAAYRSEGNVFTKEGFPEQWARVQSDLGDALATEAKITEGAAGLDLLAQAVAAYQAALGVFTQADYPERRARAQASLGQALANQGYRTGGDKGLAELKQAADAYRAATQFFTKDTAPGPWASLEEGLGAVLDTLGMNAQGGPSVEILNQAAEAWSGALTVDGKNVALAEQLASLYHEGLMDFPKAYEVVEKVEQEAPNVSNKLNLAEASLTASHFQECIDTLSSIDETQLESRDAPAKQTLLLACQWGAGQKTAAQTAAGFAAYKTGVEKTGWTTKGDRKYLADAPQFSANRGTWIDLFQSLEDADGEGMANAARTLAQAMGAKTQ